jgi:hypothetical protein
MNVMVCSALNSRINATDCFWYASRIVILSARIVMVKWSFSLLGSDAPEQGRRRKLFRLL